MKTENRFDSIDRAAAQAIVSCVVNSTRFYLTDMHLASDIPERAKRFRDGTDANLTAIAERTSADWGGRFDWQAGHLVGNQFVSPENES